MPPRFKVVVCGRAGVGKTSLLHATDPAWRPTAPTPAATVGVDFFVRTVTAADGRAAELQFWDTAGQERFAAPPALTYRAADAIIFVYDITEPPTYAAMATLLGAAIAGATGPRDPHIIVVGNKLDLAATRRAVLAAEVAEGCAARAYSFLETSAHERTNVDAMLTALVEALLPRVRSAVVPATTAATVPDLRGAALPPEPAPPSSCAC